jgi:hypothetical protein
MSVKRFPSARRHRTFAQSLFCRGDVDCPDSAVVKFPYQKQPVPYRVCLSVEGCSLKSEVPVEATETEACVV